MIRALILVFLLTGCTSLKEKFCDYQIIPPKEPIPISKEALQPCPMLVLPTLPLTLESILENQVKNKVIYTNCVNKNNAAIVLIKKLSNN